MSKAEEIAKAIYIRCFDDDFKYPDVLNALRICAEENAETIEQLQAQIEKMKNCKNCANYMISGKCPSFFRTGWCKNWEMAKGVKND